MATNLPHFHKIYRNRNLFQMTRISQLFHFKALKNLPKFGFLFWKHTIWQPWMELMHRNHKPRSRKGIFLLWKRQLGRATADRAHAHRIHAPHNWPNQFLKSRSKKISQCACQWWGRATADSFSHSSLLKSNTFGLLDFYAQNGGAFLSTVEIFRLLPSPPFSGRAQPQKPPETPHPILQGFAHVCRDLCFHLIWRKAFAPRSS
jgi:hypothetical protein